MKKNDRIFLFNMAIFFTNVAYKLTGVSYGWLNLLAIGVSCLGMFICAMMPDEK